MACTAQVLKCEGAVSCIAISPDGQLLAVGLRGSVQLLDARSGERRTRYTGTPLSVAFSPASASQLLLAAGFDDRTVRVSDCSSGARVAEIRGDHFHSLTLVYCVAFSRDGRLLASGSNNQTVRLWRTDDWHAPPAVGMVWGHTDCVLGVSFSRNGRLLASCSRDDTVKLWHIPDTAPADAPVIGPVLKVGKSVYCVSFSPADSRLLACGGFLGFLLLARVGEGDDTVAVERELQGHIETVRSLAFSPCGGKLASASEDYTVRLWSVASGMRLRVLRGHTKDVNIVAFFPNGKQLASGSDDKTIRIWTVNAWSDKTHHLFGSPLKAAVFTLMCVRARLEQEQGSPIPRLPMEVWLLVFGQLQLALAVAA